MNTAHLHLKGAAIRAVDYRESSTPDLDPYVVIAFAGDGGWTLRDGKTVVEANPELTTLYMAPGFARALATMINAALPVEPVAEPGVCEFCEGKELPDREQSNRYGGTDSVPHGPCPECGVDHGEYPEVAA